MTFDELPKYKKDLKIFFKKCRTLYEDLIVVKKVFEILPNEKPPFSFRIDNLVLDTCIIKIKKIACKSLKGRGVNSGLRLIYAYFPEVQKIIFVELFHKNDKDMEDRFRITNEFH
jgi:hypothetical protein